MMRFCVGLLLRGPSGVVRLLHIVSICCLIIVWRMLSTLRVIYTQWGHYARDHGLAYLPCF